MFFLPEQVAEYDTKRLGARELVNSNSSSRMRNPPFSGLRQQLTKKPQTFQEIHPHFIRELGGWQKHEKMIELSEFLKQNFLCYDGRGEVRARSTRTCPATSRSCAPVEGRLRAPRQGQGSLVRPGCTQGR